jgi:hypothetical protein
MLCMFHGEIMTDTFRESMKQFWDELRAAQKRKNDAGRGPWLLSPEGRAWLKEYERNRNMDRIVTPTNKPPENE